MDWPDRDGAQDAGIDAVGQDCCIAGVWHDRLSKVIRGEQACASNAHQTCKVDQIKTAERILRGQGWRALGDCGKKRWFSSQKMPIFLWAHSSMRWGAPHTLVSNVAGRKRSRVEQPPKVIDDGANMGVLVGVDACINLINKLIHNDDDLPDFLISWEASAAGPADRTLMVVRKAHIKSRPTRPADARSPTSK